MCVIKASFAWYLQGDKEGWNANILKWASSLIGSNGQSKNSGNSKVVNILWFYW